MWGGNEVLGEILISSFIKQIWPDKLSVVMNSAVIDRVMLSSCSIVFKQTFCFSIDCFDVDITSYCITLGNSQTHFISWEQNKISFYPQIIILHQNDQRKVSGILLIKIFPNMNTRIAKWIYIWFFDLIFPTIFPRCWGLQCNRGISFQFMKKWKPIISRDIDLKLLKSL